MKKRVVFLLGFSGALLAAITFYYFGGQRASEPIRVGVLHSLTGTMAISEVSVVESTTLAVEEINQSGGLLGRKIELVVRDGRSDWPTFAREMDELITQEKVDVVFGCWTSASRKTVKPVVEKYRHLLFYPVTPGRHPTNRLSQPSSGVSTIWENAFSWLGPIMSFPGRQTRLSRPKLPH